ncbi:MAG: tetratricopeptide repeat protein, partial [Bacteroidota bacterium]
MPLQAVRDKGAYEETSGKHLATPGLAQGSSSGQMPGSSQIVRDAESCHTPRSAASHDARLAPVTPDLDTSQASGSAIASESQLPSPAQLLASQEEQDALSLVDQLKALASDPQIDQQPEQLADLGAVLLQLAASKQEESGSSAQDLSPYTDAAILYQHVLSLCAQEAGILASQEYDTTTFENLARASKAQSHLLRVVFHDQSSPETGFTNQLAQLKVLLNSLGKAGALFISRVSPDSPYLLGMLYGNNLILLNPVGVTQDQALYTVLSDIEQQSLVEELYVSDALIAQEEQASYAGPIVAELMRHYSQLNKEDFELALSQLYSLGAGCQESIPDQASEQSSYKTIDISSLLPPSLSSLGQSESSSPASTGEVLTKLRQSHVSILSAVSDATAYLPEQMTFNALVSGVPIDFLHDNPHYRQLKEESILPPGVAGYQREIEQIAAPSSALGPSSSQMPSSSRTPQATRPEPSMPSSSQVPSTSQAARLAEHPTTTTATPPRTTSSAKGKAPYRPHPAIHVSDLGFLTSIGQLAENKGPTPLGLDQIEAKRLKEQIDKLYPKLLQTTDEADAKQLVEELITPLERLLELVDQTLVEEIDNAQNYLVSFRQVHHERWSQTAYGAEVGNKLTALLERAYVQGLKAANSDLRLTKTPAGILRLAKTLGQLASLDQERGAKAGDLFYYTDAAILYQHVLSICAKEQDTLDSEEAAALQSSAHQGLAQLQASMLAQAKGVDVGATTQADVASLQKRIAEDRGELEAFRAVVKPRAAALVNGLEAVLSGPEHSAEAIKRAEEAYIQGSQNLFSKIKQWMSELLAKLYQESELALGQAPCKYTVMGLGSMALQQITPYSDLEFAILVEDAPDEDTAEVWRKYFRKLTHLVHFRVINLGETVVPFGKYKLSLDHLGKRGLNFDLGGKTPLGRKDKPHLKKPYELIQPVSGMVYYLRNVADKMEHMDKLLPYILESTCYVYGDSSLHECYVAEKRTFLLESRDESGKPAYQKRALKKLIEGVVEMDYSNSKLAKAKPHPGDLEDFAVRFDAEDVGRLYDVKQEIYRLPDRLLYRLAMYYGILPTSGWDAVGQLKQRGIIGVGENAQQAAHHLHYAVSFATMLRLRTYVHYGQQQEGATMLSDVRQEEEVQQAVQVAFTLPASSLQVGGSLFKYYYTAFSLHRKMEEFFGALGLLPQVLVWFSSNLLGRAAELAPWKGSFFQKEPFYDSSAETRGDIHRRLLQHKEVKDSYEKALAIDEQRYGPNHPYIARTLHNLGNAQYALGEATEAVSYFERALGIWNKVYGPNHPHVALALSNLGLAWGALGDARKAVSYYERVLAIYEQVYQAEPNHPDVARTLNNLGNAWIALGEATKAVSYFERALGIWNKVYGPNNPEAAVAMNLNDLGIAWNALGDARKAISYYERALMIREQMYGPNHPEVARSLNNLGSAWINLGDARKAVSYLERSLAIKEQVYGSNHPRVASPLHNLGLAWRILGEATKAVSYHERALGIREQVYGPNHPEVACSLSNLGDAWDDLREAAKAMSYHERALGIREQVYGPNHPEVACSLYDLGNTWLALGEANKAVSYYERALGICERVHDPNHPDAATTLVGLGHAWRALGEANKAMSYYKCSLCIFEQVYGTKHSDVATTLVGLGNAWLDLGETNKAVSYYERSLGIFEQVYGAKHPHVALALYNLGHAWLALGEANKAVSYYERALAIKEQVYQKNSNHPQLASALIDLAAAWGDLGDLRKKVSYLERTLGILEQVYQADSNHPNIASNLYNLGLAWRDLGDATKAVSYFERSLAIFEQVYKGDSNHPNIASNLYNLGLAWRDLGEATKAVSYFERALAIYEQVYDLNHPAITSTLTGLGLAWGALGKVNKALSYLERALGIREQVYGPNHLDLVDLAETLSTWGTLWGASGDANKAVSYLERALGIYEQVYKENPNHPEIAHTLTNLGSAWGTLGDANKAVSYYAKALEYYQQALAMQQALHKGENHDEVAQVLRNVGIAYERLGNHAESLDYYQQALQMQQALHEGNHAEVAQALSSVGVAYAGLGQHKQALEYYQQALAMRKALHEGNHPDVAQALHSVGAACHQLDQHEQALDYFKQALAMRQALHEGNHPEVAEALRTVGIAYERLGNYTQALGYYQQALQMQQALHEGENHADVAEALRTVGIAYVRL